MPVDVVKIRLPQLDYDALAEAYTDALGRIDILEEYALRMLTLCEFRKYDP